MRIALIQILGLLISLDLLAAGVSDSTFIRHEGRYTPEPSASFTVSADPSGLLVCAVGFSHREAGEISRVMNKVTLDIQHGGKFLGYWDRTNQTFWIATSKRVIAASRMGTNYPTTYYDNTAKTLARAPALFRKEAQKVFTSRHWPGVPHPGA